jgi:hypothetical protein
VLFPSDSPPNLGRQAAAVPILKNFFLFYLQHRPSNFGHPAEIRMRF